MADRDVYLWHHVFEAGTMGANFVKEGVIRTIEVEGHRMLVVRRGEKLFAMRSKCPHNGASLERAYLEKDEIICPWHRFRFCVESGENRSGEGYHLEHYPVELREDGMYVGIRQRRGWF